MVCSTKLTSDPAGVAGIAEESPPVDQEVATIGKEVFGLDILRPTEDNIPSSRVQELMAIMNADVPTGGADFPYGHQSAQVLRFWKSSQAMAPLVIFHPRW